MDIFTQAVKKLSMGSRTKKEMKEYLRGRGFSSDEINETIEVLENLDYLDDCRYGEDYFRYAAGKGWSKARAVRELTNKGLSSEDIEDAYAGYSEEYADDERERAIEVARKMAEGADLDERGRLTEKIRNRIARRLFSYGYASGVIYETLAKLEGELVQE